MILSWNLGITGRSAALRYALRAADGSTVLTWTQTGISEIIIGGVATMEYEVDADVTGAETIHWRDTTSGQESFSSSPIRSGLTAAEVRSAVGLATANLDAQLGAVAGYIDTEVAAIKAKTDLIPAAPAAVGNIPTALEVATQVNSTLSDSHGYGSWLEPATGALTGPSAVTLTFLDSNSDPVPLVDFTIQGQGVARANSSGVASFGLSDGTYTVVSRPTLGIVFNSATLVVDGDTAQSIIGASSVIVPSGPDNPLLCRVYGYQYINGEPNEGTRVFAYAYGPPVTIDGLILETTTVHTDTDEDGYWALDLLRTGVYRITIPNSDINNVQITVPDSNTVDFTTLF
jgi:hypothetical protein